MSAELYRFKFPEGHESRLNYKIDSLRPEDNSTFEYTYETYEERMKKKTEEMRLMREEDKAKEKIKVASLSNRILPPQVLEVVGKDQTLQEVSSQLDTSKFSENVINYEPLLRHHFKRIKFEGEEAQGHLAKANLRLVVSVA